MTFSLPNVDGPAAGELVCPAIPMETASTAPSPHLTRGFGLLHATALNMTNMVGIGPFITIPLLMAAMGGPQSLLGWLVGALIVVCDGQVWSELGAALPGSGGSYRFLRESYGPQKWGRFMAFLFIWSFVLSGPLEIASGLIGFSQYATYLWPGLANGGDRLLGAGGGLPAPIPPARRGPLLPPPPGPPSLGPGAPPAPPLPSRRP